MTTAHSTIRLLVYALFLAEGVFTLCLQAQTTSTEILGTVSDSSGSVVPGATVTITKVATGEKRTAVANRSGEFTFPLIDIGEYTVRVEMQGFRSQTVTGLRVEIQQKARVDFVLEVGQLTQSVEVAASSVALATEDAAVGQVIERKRTADLPLNGRNIISLAVLVPGVQYGSRNGNSDGQGGYPIPGLGFSVIANGQREINESVTLDGVDATMPLYNVTTWTPSIDAIEEFKVQTGSYSAEYGQGAGAHIQISLKSGTNQLRGTVFEFVRNDKLDAENYFLNFEPAPGVARIPKDRLRRNQFGIFLGGPLIRNKTFWSFNYEGRRQDKESVSTTSWPDQNFRNGDFSELLHTAINPATGAPFRAPTIIYDPLNGVPFSNNVLPQSRLHPGALNVISKYLPLPDFQPADVLDFNVRRAIPQPSDGNQYFGRVDHSFSDKDKVFGRIAVDRAFWMNNNINPNFPQSTASNAWNLGTQWIHTFSQSVLNEFRFGVNDWNDYLAALRSNTNFDPDSLGIGAIRVASSNNRKLTPLETGIPTIGFTVGDANGRIDYNYTYQFANNITIIRGKHFIKIGGQYSYITLDRWDGNVLRGSLSFSANESGYNFASFLLGYPNKVLTPEGFPESNLAEHRAGAYITDDWKVTSRLTLSMGFRWDYNGNPVNQLGNWRTLDFGVRAPLYITPAGDKIPTLFPAQPLSDSSKIKLWEQSPGYFQPRLGIAYRATNKWVMRAGAGAFYSPQILVDYTILNYAPPASGSQQLDSVTDSAQKVPLTVNGQTYSLQTRVFRPGSPILTLNDPFTGNTGPHPLNVLALAPDHKVSNVWQWSYDIQRELPKGTALTVGYVGSKTSHVPNSIVNFNSAPPSQNTDAQSRRFLPLFYDPYDPAKGVQGLGTIRYLDSGGNGFYHGLQVKLEKRYSRGFSYGFAYTFSKANGDGEAGANESGGIQDARNVQGSRARYSFDQTHSAMIHWVWEIPFGKTLTGVPGVILKGWQTNGIVTLRSGFPFSATANSGDLNTGGGDQTRPDLLMGRNGTVANPSRRLWFDPTAFQRVTCNIAGRPDLCHYGNAGRNILDSPGMRDLDFSLFKSFSITERCALTFRTELFNALNTPHFGQPTNLGFVNATSIVPDAPRMGEIRSLRGDMRQIQFGLKLSF